MIHSLVTFYSRLLPCINALQCFISSSDPTRFGQWFVILRSTFNQQEPPLLMIREAPVKAVSPVLVPAKDIVGLWMLHFPRTNVIGQWNSEGGHSLWWMQFEGGRSLKVVIVWRWAPFEGGDSLKVDTVCGPLNPWTPTYCWNAGFPGSKGHLQTWSLAMMMKVVQNRK